MIMAVLLCLSGFVLYSFFVIYRYAHFAYGDWDMAFINQTLWNLLHGKMHSSLFGFDYLGDHTNFINVLILPLFALFPHPLTFSFLQIFLFSFSALFLYFLVEGDLGKPAALMFMFAYLIFPPNFFAMCHDHNPEALSPLFFLMAVFFYRKKEIRGFYLSILTLLLIKENMPLIVAMFSLWGLCAKNRSRVWWGLFPLIFSVIFFFTAVKWVIPHFRGLEHDYLLVRFHYLGDEPKVIFYHLLQWDTLKSIFLSAANINFLFSLFGVLLIPALLSPSLLLLILPVIAYHLISAHIPEKTIYYHYAATMTPAIFLASAQTLKKINMRPFFRLFFCFIIILYSLEAIYLLRYKIAEKVGFIGQTASLNKWRLVNKIPAGASTIATFEFLPVLSLRDELYSFHKVYSDEYQDALSFKLSDFYSKETFHVPAHVEYALIDFNDAWLQNSLHNDPIRTKSRISHFLIGWIKIDSVGSVKLFKRQI